ncbi:diguanylate cyclase [Vibrio sp. Y2-5]|uniref:sensor domain-containing diguanylate cyclase n=1 Tax=Vibrio TaxID=662 RepID=UPI00142D7FF9|nr:MULTISPECIES: diguanylate cyclase [Vibrio]MBD0784881.1 diguanylate cyclase [Vibrio sp. Y2-5]NIY92804.1 diguanylate cyclase [Vibrio diazotrophicus]
MIFNNVSVRWITVITAVSVVICFVTCYLAFKYLWAYDRQVAQAEELQREEIERVETVIDIAKLKLGDSIVDYAAWDDMVEFIRSPNEEFIESGIGAHSYTSQLINGFFVFAADKTLVWGKALDAENNHLVDDQRYTQYFSTILDQAEQRDTSFVQAIVHFIVIDNEPYFAAASRVCNSDASGCDKGYIIFFKKLSEQFSKQVNKATGIQIDILVNGSNIQTLEPSENISYITKLDYNAGSSVIIKIYHHVKIPSFIVWQEVFALMAFSIMFYFINLLLAKSLVKPITNANLVLDKFQAQGGVIPDESYFISKEMKGFARTINKIMNDLEASRRELRWQSEHDPLTELSNRRHLKSRLTALINDNHFSHIALYLVDVDFFKLYNDNLSHMDGDNALKAVAKVLEAVEYKGEKIVARFGGEEFCVVFASDVPINLNEYAQILKDAVSSLKISHPFIPVEGREYLSISIGGIQIDKPSIAYYQEMFHQADQALYSAKRKGRDQYVVQQFNKHSDRLVGVN